MFPAFSSRFSGWASLALAAMVACAGCGKPPVPEFVASQRTEELYPDAQKLVTNAVNANFGEPTASVAWLKLPVDYGVFEGEVASAGETMSNEFEIKWTSPENAAELLKKSDLSGAGFLWNSGRNVGALTGSAKKPTTIDFQVVDYNHETGVVGLNALLEAAPQPGDKFTVVGSNLQDGRRLYMQHCVHCHGVSGDGNGPTAKYLNPLPRDYRLGVFKFTSTPNPDRPSRSDLHRIIRQGIPGTYMPSFLLLEDKELHAITEYVRWLSMRGEYEKRLTDGFYSEFNAKSVTDRIKKGEKKSEILADITGAEFAEEYAETVDSTGASLARAWIKADEAATTVNPKKPRTDPTKENESIARGRKLYLSDKTKCVSCHGPAGKGDGPQTTDFQKRPDGTEYDKPGLFDAWNHPLRPRDLTQGIYRGGRRPVDLYRRLHAGIKGTPMPAFGTALNDDEIWDIINYVMSVPFDGKAPPTLPAAAEPTETADKASGVESRLAGSQADK